MIIDKELLDDLCEKAIESQRLRMNYDLRDTEEDGAQRMLNALQCGTIIPIHRHRDTSETAFVLRGKVKWLFYSDNGNVEESYIVAPDSEIFGLSVPIGQWHSLECLENNSVIVSIKNGAWHPLDVKDILTQNNCVQK